MFDKAISLVIPVYNEEAIIEESILIFIKLLSEMFSDFEIIVVNDGSNDHTKDILSWLSSKDGRVKVFNNRDNLGSGASLWRGFQKATKELVVSNFADRPFDLRELKEVLPIFQDPRIDFVIIARKDRSANNLYRKITSYFNFFLIRFLFNAQISDFQFVQVYRNRILKDIQIRSKGTFVPPELMFKLISRGYKFKEARSRFYKRTKGRSKCGSPSRILRTLIEMFSFWFRIKTGKD